MFPFKRKRKWKRKANRLDAVVGFEVLALVLACIACAGFEYYYLKVAVYNDAEHNGLVR